MNVQLLVDTPDMRVQRAHADAELVRNLLVEQPAHKPIKHLLLSDGELRLGGPVARDGARG